MNYQVICTGDLSMSSRLTSRIRKERSLHDGILQQIVGEAGKNRLNKDRATMEVTGNRLKIRIVDLSDDREESVQDVLDTMWRYLTRIWRMDLRRGRSQTRVKDVSIELIEISD